MGEWLEKLLDKALDDLVDKALENIDGLDDLIQKLFLDKIKAKLEKKFNINL